MCSIASESFPPDRPSITRSPGTTICHSETAFATDRISFAGGDANPRPAKATSVAGADEDFSGSTRRGGSLGSGVPSAGTPDASSSEDAVDRAVGRSVVVVFAGRSGPFVSAGGVVRSSARPLASTSDSFPGAETAVSSPRRATASPPLPSTPADAAVTRSGYLEDTARNETSHDTSPSRSPTRSKPLGHASALAKRSDAPRASS
mmetsp:Transcript_9678/g.40573  ORF Transcript_9678/g.40573 Transcript_9678/m.40573 type:complete len:205 (+) Transcript_9678:1947-2561(+)